MAWVHGGGPSPLVTQRVASFVDMAWLRERARQLTGNSEARLDAAAVHAYLEARARQQRSYLRTYVYEAQYAVGHARYADKQADLDAISEVPGVELRLGHLIERGKTTQQKGVDTLLVLDMLTLANQGAYHAAILVAGDRDFAEPVRVIQGLGIWVYQCGPEQRDAVARELRQITDGFMPITNDVLSSWVLPSRRYD